ncbi:hypothetical protein SEUCBS140593_010412 [Sporothrix eucalyptigena]|uniref:Aminoglycoside phosphotransferase domain-containing protein n=1 Tax=Sporothrix eucalyptigena TaxID=1812306 RepID=A0ABP0D3Y0_9PEZI
MSLSKTNNLVALNWKEHKYNLDASMDNAMRQTNWPALCQLAANLRDDVPCVPLDYATNGLNNMARLLQFEDGVLWVARVAMRRSSADTAKLRSEVDTMRWIRHQSSLPVPEIFAYEVDEHNAVGVPFVLMSFVPGNTAMDAGGGYETHHGIIPAAHRLRFYHAVAACHVSLFKPLRTPDGKFDAGPIPGIGGPFDTATAFFTAWADHTRFPRQSDEILDIMRGAPEAEQVLRAVDNFLSRFRAVAPRLVYRNDRNHDSGPFPLCHPDFLHSNIIVDDSNFDVLGIIDWEGACTLPLELVRFPRFLNALPRRFGRSDRYSEDGQPHDTDEQQRWHERHEYVQMVASLEALERGGDHTLSACLADEHAQNLSYAMEAFEGGKMGFYDQLLDDLEEGLPPGGRSL